MLPLRLLLAAALVSSLPAATLYTITFDAGDPIGGLAVNDVLGSQYAAATGATFSPNGFSGPGGPSGNWGTNSNMTIVASGGSDVGGLGTPSLVSGNLLRSFNGWLGENGDPSFMISFAGAGVSDFSAVFAGIATPASTRVFAYNGATLLTTVVASTVTGQQTLSVSGVGNITHVVVTPGDFFDWVGVDNISFTAADGAAVPEPSSYALLGSALIAGWAMRHRIGRR